MSTRSIAFLACVFCSGAMLSGAPLDDKIKAFEDAVKTAPETNTSSSAWPGGRVLTVTDLETVLQRDPSHDADIEGIISQLMATHPSDSVRRAGQAVIAELQNRRQERARDFQAKADAAVAKAKDTLAHAKSAKDLDEILGELHSLQVYSDGYGSSNSLASTFQFVTQWQSYLSASADKNWPDAQNSLRSILNNQQIDAPQFFPRSEILDKYEDALRGGVKSQAQEAAPATGNVNDPDAILAKVKTAEDLDTVLPELFMLPTVPGYNAWDWSEFVNLSRARGDSLAGFTVDLDLKKAMTWPAWGYQYSRVTALELLEILPHYFGTNVSSPPKPNETITDYLDRLIDEAGKAGNLGLIQRVVIVQVALATANGGSATGTQSFLAGLSLDYAGQYDSAVVAYETALKSPDRYLPVKIVGERLTAIQAAHPNDFAKGMNDFTNPPLNAADPINQPFWMQQRVLHQLPPNSPPYLRNRPVLMPIMDIISIPKKADTSAPTSGAPTTPPAQK